MSQNQQQPTSTQVHIIRFGVVDLIWKFTKWIYLPWMLVVLIFAYPWILLIIGALAAIVLYFGLRAARDVDRSRREHRE